VAGFDLDVDLVLIGFEWPNLWWWVSVGSRSPVRVGQGDRGSGTVGWVSVDRRWRG
jgi:hypothetical protein